METIAALLGLAVGDNEAVILNYINFVGAEEVLSLTLRFNVLRFVGKWEQVLTSLSTNLLGSGIFYSTVQANYSLNRDGTIKVVNSAYNGDFEFEKVEGTSKARSPLVPTCRTVTFNDTKIEGNYWIIYISQDFNTIIVSAPIIIGPIDLSSNFGLYVLTRDREKFWNSNEPTNVFNTLKKYGFEKFWNKPVNSGKSYPAPLQEDKKIVKKPVRKIIRK